MLKMDVPNFQYTYGYGRSYDSYDDLNKKFNWCKTVNNKTNQGFIVMENILNSVNLKTFINDESIDMIDIVKCYLQMFNALNIAQFLYNFSHNYIKLTNIFVRKFDKEIKINVYHNLEIVGELSTKYVPYFTTFDHCTVIVDNTKYARDYIDEKYMSDPDKVHSRSRTNIDNDFRAIIDGLSKSKRDDAKSFGYDLQDVINDGTGFRQPNNPTIRFNGMSYLTIINHIVSNYNIVDPDHIVKYKNYSLSQIHNMIQPKTIKEFVIQLQDNPEHVTDILKTIPTDIFDKTIAQIERDFDKQSLRMDNLKLNRYISDVDNDAHTLSEYMIVPQSFFDKIEAIYRKILFSEKIYK